MAVRRAPERLSGKDTSSGEAKPHGAPNYNKQVMQYPFPDEFPEKSRRALLAEEIRGTRDLEKAKKEGGVSKLQDLLIGFILRMLIVFVREASELVHQRIWSAGRLESESLQFLHHCTVSARYERGNDKYGNQIGEMVSNWGSILPDVERAFKKSPLWKEYEDILLEVAVAPAEPQTIRAVEALGVSAPPAPAKKNAGTTAEAPEPREGREAKNPVRRNQKYRVIDKALQELAESRPRTQEEVFQALEGRHVVHPPAEPFMAARGWMAGFRKSPAAARAWLSKRWAELDLDPLPRGPKK